MRPCHQDIARPQDADGGVGLQIWEVAVNISNEQLRQPTRESPPQFEYLERG